METTLLPRLEQAGLTCIYKERFRPGAIELDEIERAVRESRH